MSTNESAAQPMAMGRKSHPEDAIEPAGSGCLQAYAGEICYKIDHIPDTATYNIRAYPVDAPDTYHDILSVGFLQSPAARLTGEQSYDKLSLTETFQFADGAKRQLKFQLVGGTLVFDSDVVGNVSGTPGSKSADNFYVHGNSSNSIWCNENVFCSRVLCLSQDGSQSHKILLTVSASLTDVLLFAPEEPAGEVRNWSYNHILAEPGKDSDNAFEELFEDPTFSEFDYPTFALPFSLLECAQSGSLLDPVDRDTVVSLPIVFDCSADMPNFSSYWASGRVCVLRTPETLIGHAPPTSLEEVWRKLACFCLLSGWYPKLYTDLPVYINRKILAGLHPMVARLQEKAFELRTKGFQVPYKYEYQYRPDDFRTIEHLWIEKHTFEEFMGQVVRMTSQDGTITATVNFARVPAPIVVQGIAAILEPYGWLVEDTETGASSFSGIYCAGVGPLAELFPNHVRSEWFMGEKGGYYHGAAKPGLALSTHLGFPEKIEKPGLAFHNGKGVMATDPDLVG